MGEFDNLKSSIDKFGERLGALEQKIPVIEERYDHMNELIKQNVAVLEKLDTTLQDNRIAMEHITSSIEMTKTHVSELDEEVSHVNQKVNDLEDERTFNFISWVKNNFISIIVCCALIYYLVAK